MAADRDDIYIGTTAALYDACVLPDQASDSAQSARSAYSAVSAGAAYKTIITVAAFSAVTGVAAVLIAVRYS